MVKQVIGIGTAPNDGTGEPVRSAFNKINLNFTELYDGKADAAAMTTALAAKADSSAMTTALAAKANSSDMTTALAAKAATSHTHTAANISDFTEALQDILSTSLVAGANVTLTYNDAGNALTIAATGGAGGGLDLEAVQDAVAAMVLPGSGMTAAYNDTAGSLTLAVTGAAATLPWINVKDYGAVGNGSADDTLAIQAAIDYALHFGIGTVLIPDGTYKVSNTIHLGYGIGDTAGNNGFNSIRIQGSFGFGADTNVGKARTKIVSTFTDRPIINIQGGRRCGIDRLWITGPTNFDYYGPFTLEKRANRANYIPPTCVTTDPRAPFCGVCIDGYSGSVQTPGYPVPPYPSWMTPPASHYGRNYSSACYVTNCDIQYTLVGIMCQPNFDSNGDFMDFGHTNIWGCDVGVAIGNTQARSTNYNKMIFSGCHTMIDGCTYGLGHGNVHGDMTNIHADYCFQFLKFDPTWTKPLVVNGFYSEKVSRIGETTTRGQDIVFQGCYFNVEQLLYNDKYVVPVWDGGTPAKFNNCVITGWSEGLHFPNQSRFERVYVARFPGLPDDNSVEGKMIQAYGSILVQTASDGSGQGDNPFIQCRMPGDYSGRDHNGKTTVHSMGLDQGPAINYMGTMTNRGETTTLADMVWSGRSATCTCPKDFIQVGDVLKTWEGANFLIVTSVSGAGPFNLTVDLLTNYKYTSATTSYANFIGDPTSLSVLYTPHTAVDMIPQELFWVTTAGSPEVQLINYVNTPIAIPAAVTTKTRAFWFSTNCTQWYPAMPFGHRVKITAVNATSITMSQNAKISGMWAYAPGIIRIL